MKSLFIVSAILSSIPFFSCTNNSTENNPNIVLIVADDLGYGDISCYGSTNIQTPNLDFLSSEGIRFTDFHSNGAVCSPTRAALMTGKYQQRTGVEGVITAKSHREKGLNLQEVTIAEELKKYGYTCGLFGKWHLGYSKDYNPTLQGFDEFVGFVSGNIDYLAHIDQEGYLDWWKGNKIDNENGYTTDLITDYGTEFIRKYNPAKTKKPFFLYLPHEAPHYPYQLRNSKILREVGKAGSLPVNQDSIPFIYKRMVEIMDEGIGKIVQALKETEQYENTLMIFISDNGANQNGSNGILRGFKGSAYEGGSRVPAIVSFPGKLEKGAINNQTVLTMDLLPTLLDFIDQQPTSASIDGISIKNNLLQGTDLPERDLFFSFKNRSFIRSDCWKLIRVENNNHVTTELFNLCNDPEEKINLALIHPEIVTEMNKKLDNWGKEVRKGVKLISK